MLKLKKGNLLIDISISLLFISSVILVCYSTATTAINKRYETAKERDALVIAENIMSRVLATGFNHVDNEPMISSDKVIRINEILKSSLSQTEKNRELLEIGARAPVTTGSGGDAPFLQNSASGFSREYSYQVIVEPYVVTSGESKYYETTLSQITVNVYYPIKISKYVNIENKNNEKVSLEEDYRFVTISTLKAAKEYKVE